MKKKNKTFKIRFVRLLRRFRKKFIKIIGKVLGLLDYIFIGGILGGIQFRVSDGIAREGTNIPRTDPRHHQFHPKRIFLSTDTDADKARKGREVEWMFYKIEEGERLAREHFDDFPTGESNINCAIWLTLLIIATTFLVFGGEIQFLKYGGFLDLGFEQYVNGLSPKVIGCYEKGCGFHSIGVEHKYLYTIIIIIDHEIAFTGGWLIMRQQANREGVIRSRKQREERFRKHGNDSLKEDLNFVWTEDRKKKK